MRTTLIRPDGQRLVIEPSHTFRSVRIWSPGGEPGEIITVPRELTGAFCQAVEGAAQAIEQTDRLTSAEG